MLTYVPAHCPPQFGVITNGTCTTVLHLLLSILSSMSLLVKTHNNGGSAFHFDCNTNSGETIKQLTERL